MLPPPVFSVNGDIHDDVIREKVIPKIKQVADKDNLSTINLYSPFVGKRMFFPDNLHPNAQGAKAHGRPYISGVGGRNDTRGAGTEQ